MTQHVLPKKSLLAISLLIAAICTSILTAAASSSSDYAQRIFVPYSHAATSGSSTPEPQKDTTQKLTQHPLQKMSYYDLNQKYLLREELPDQVESINGRFTLRYKIIGKLFQEHENRIYSFDDLFAVAWHQKSLSQLASFVYFVANKDASKFTPKEKRIKNYPIELLPHLALNIGQFIAHHSIPLLIDPFYRNDLSISYSQLASLDGIEAMPDTEKVIRINAEYNKLTDLPDTIGIFKQLKYLDLRNNQLTTLPDTLWDLLNLKLLALDTNRFTSLPDSISNLTQLKILVLNNNQLTDLSDSIGKLPNLQKLHLAYNRFSLLPDAVSNLTQLDFLNLSGNLFTTLPDTISNLTRLQSLFLGNNNFSGAERDHIQKIIEQATNGKCDIWWD